jgi:DNA-binding transcriptional regulator GbsR (MarR family)
MRLPEAKEKFIQAWGTLATHWGISRTMAQVHALLLISPTSLSAEDVMEQLTISRGNANMNLRALIDWGLVSKELKSGERKEFFSAEKDVWKIFKQIAKERKKREIEPIGSILEELKTIEGDKANADIKAFTNTIQDFQKFFSKTNKAIDTVIQADENWFFSTLIKLLK